MPLFTPETAAINGRKGAIIRWTPKPPPPEPAKPPPIATPTFADKTLLRVRKQIERLSDEIDDAIEGDSKKLKELTDALARLNEVERQLSGRPLPGTLKPRQSRSDPAPIYAPPTPVQPPSTPQPVDDCGSDEVSI